MVESREVQLIFMFPGFIVTSLAVFISRVLPFVFIDFSHLMAVYRFFFFLFILGFLPCSS